MCAANNHSIYVVKYFFSFSAIIGDHKKNSNKVLHKKQSDAFKATRFKGTYPGMKSQASIAVHRTHWTKSCTISQNHEVKSKENSKQWTTVKPVLSKFVIRKGPEVRNSAKHYVLSHQKHLNTRPHDTTSKCQNLTSGVDMKPQANRTGYLPSKKPQEYEKDSSFNTGCQNSQVHNAQSHKTASRISTLFIEPQNRSGPGQACNINDNKKSLKKFVIRNRDTPSTETSKYKWVSPQTSPVKTLVSDIPKTSLIFPNKKVAAKSETVAEECQFSHPKHSPYIFSLNPPEEGSSMFNVSQSKSPLRDDVKVYSSTPELSCQLKLPVPLKTVKSSRYKIVKQAISPIANKIEKKGPVQSFSVKKFSTQASDIPYNVSANKEQSIVKNKYKYVNKKSVSRSSPSIPVVLNKYKLVRRRKSSEKYKPTKFKIKDLNSIKLSPAQMIKLTSRHKLIKRSLQSYQLPRQHLSGHHSSYKTSSYNKPSYRTENIRERQIRPILHGRKKCQRHEMNKPSSKYALKNNGQGNFFQKF